jgi:transcription-repair coupling factor (superfamily II helicase)
LARIGSGGVWKNKVARIKNRSSVFVEELIRAYLDRQRIASDVYYLDKELEDSFLKGFVFKDTIDQKSSWGEIKKDLLSLKPMDRLLCGDVGFGKTELAIRSCFLSSINGFGSLVLAPTTILAKQLFSSFSNRLSSYGVVVGFVSRFVEEKKPTTTP